MEKQNWFKRKFTLTLFAIISFIMGLLFIKKGNITGNVILNHYHSITTLSIVGLLLIFCSIILAVYIIEKE